MLINYMKYTIFLQRKAERYIAQRERIITRATRTGTHTTDDKVQTTPKKDTMEINAVAIADLSIIIEDYIRRIAYRTAKAQDIINHSELDFTARQILELRYVKCYRWGKVAKLSGYSVRHAQRIHDTAILELEG